MKVETEQIEKFNPKYYHKHYDKCKCGKTKGIMAKRCIDCFRSRKRGKLSYMENRKNQNVKTK